MRPNLESRLVALEARAPDVSGAMAVALTTDRMTPEEVNAEVAEAIRRWQSGHGRNFPATGSVMRIVLCGLKPERPNPRENGHAG